MIAVVGVPRSSTSFCAEVLRLCGIFMGEDLDRGPPDWTKHGLCEDKEFRWLHNLMRDPGQHRACAQLRPDLLAAEADLIRRRDAEHLLWGIKSWQLLMHVLRLGASVRPPALLVYTRRSVEHSIASLVARGYDPDLAARRCRELSVLLDEAVSAWQGPLLEIQHQEINCNPIGTVKQLAEFVGLEATPEALALYDPAWQRFGG